jgi:cation diffusion facilitator family transporter
VSTDRKTRAASLSVISNISLVVFKLTVGLLTGAVSVMAEALHSAIDLLAALIAFFSIRIAAQPADSDHPFGHGKAESISGALEALLIVGAAIWIVIEAVAKLFDGQQAAHLELGIGVMVISAIINILVSRHLLRVAKETDSLALEADGHHLATDVMTSLGVAAGLGLVWWTGWQPLDAIVALGVAVWIGLLGWKLTVTASKQLMDHGLPEEDIEKVRRILQAESRILSWHDLRTRKAGNQRHVDLHIVCPGDMLLKNAHQVADDLEKSIAETLHPATVVIHLDPAGGEEAPSVSD